MLEYHDVSDLSATIRDNLHRLPSDLDLIVGIPRSGLLAANILALYLNLPVTDVDGYLAGRLLSTGFRPVPGMHSLSESESLKVLVLDDSIMSGSELARTRARIEASPHGARHQLLFGVVYALAQNADAVDVYFELTYPRRIFEWNLFHSWIIRESCVDIDGVLCRDPTEEENDDGPRYAEFLENATPYLIPTQPIGWLVTNRLEKYRGPTEAWLARHGICFEHLIMRDLPSKAARLASNNHSAFKAETYLESDAELFIESSLWQAREIALLTGRPVFCVEIWQMFNGTSWSSFTSAAGRREKMEMEVTAYDRMGGLHSPLNSPWTLLRMLRRYRLRLLPWLWKRVRHRWLG